MSETVEWLYERVLVLRCQAGDEAAFEEIVRRHHDRLRYYVQKMIGRGEAEDVLQEVWLDVFRSIPRLREVGAFKNWLYRIARDRVFRRLRQERSPISLNEASVEPSAPENGEFSEEDAARIHAALDDLSPEHREVLVLRFLEEMDYEQIAGVIGEPVGTVRSRLHYAKRALRCAIERMNDHG